MNDLYWLNAHAGKRTTPYPHEVADPFDVPRCPQCHAPLADPLRVYCDAACMRAHQARLAYAAAEAGRHERRLGLRHYGDG